MQITFQDPTGTRTSTVELKRILTDSVGDLLCRWGDGKPPGFTANAGTVNGHARVLASLKALDHALELLGERDRGGLKAKLLEQRGVLAASLEGIEGLAGDSASTDKPQCQGERYRAVLTLVESAYAACLDAQAALAAADEGTVLARRADVELAEARLRSANRAFAELRAAAAFPALPDIAAIARAESQCAELAQLSRRPDKARALEAALLQGATTPASVAQYWVCFEPRSSDPDGLFAWRLRRFEEER